jgi:toxin ParE1/3/4
VKLVFSQAAEADLEEIADHIAKDNAHRALTFVQELRARAQDIRRMPRAFPLVPRYAQHAIRRRRYGNYLIFYRAEDDQVSIVRILHGARDHEALLLPMES